MPALQETTTERNSERSLRVLYAEDMPELRSLFELVLGREGHTVESVADGADAIFRVAETSGNYDVIITDHHMPQMNGLELVRRLRRFGFEGKILVFSSELSKDVINAYHELQVDQILFKPIFPAELRELFNRM